MRTLIVLIVIAGWTLTSTPTRAQSSDSAPGAGNVITVGVKAGVGFPQINSEFGTAPSVQLEASYLLPFLAGRLGLVSALGYGAPSLSGTAQDDRLPGGSYSYSATQRQLNWDLGVLGKLKPWASPWNVTALAGVRLTFQSTLSDGEAGAEPFGEHDERATMAGFFISGQGDYRLGPGALVGELGYWASFQDLRTTGDLVVSEVMVLVGYRLAFAL